MKNKCHKLLKKLSSIPIKYEYSCIKAHKWVRKNKTCAWYLMKYFLSFRVGASSSLLPPQEAYLPFDNTFTPNPTTKSLRESLFHYHFFILW